jgi:uncharacterized membrane protein YhaH (DUF805 family)
MSALPTFHDLFDPRGRANRGGLLKVAVLLLAADVVAVAVIAATGAAFTGAAALAFKLVSVWIATAAVARRLHDVGFSAWWIAKGLAALIAWSIAVAVALLTRYTAAEALDPAQSAFWLNLALTSAPVLAALGWLHVARGDAAANRYGPPPGASGFSAPHAEASAAGLAGSDVAGAQPI